LFHRGEPMQESRWTRSSLLLAFLLGAGVLLPPELHPAGMALQAALSGGLLWLLMRQFPRLWSWGALGAPLLAAATLLPSVLLSHQRHTSEAVLYQLFPAVVAFIAAGQQAGTRRGREQFDRLMIALGTTASLWGICQTTFSLSRTARYLRSLGQKELDPMILRAESGRAFGPFLLPADLGIFLAMVLPLTLLWLIGEKRRGWRILAWTVLLIQVLGLAASRSYGGVLSLLAAALMLLPISRVKEGVRIWSGLLACGLAAGGGLFLLRGGEGLTPLFLRVKNWAVAIRIFRSHPFFGVGPGNFGDAFTRHLVPGMNETVFAHNTYLQVMAESGLAGLALVLAGAGWLLWKIGTGLRGDELGRARLAASLPPVAFLIHNLFDFSAYLPSLLLPFAALCAIAVRPSHPVPRPAVPRVRWKWARLFTVGLLLSGTVLWGLREAQTEALLRRARSTLETDRLEPALRDLTKASRLNPAHPDPPALLAEIHLARISSRPAARSEGEAWARRWVALRPCRAYGHYVLSLYRLAGGDLGESWVELSRARELYPGRELYLGQEAKLREMIASSMRRKGSANGS
ncbi:MAG: O-antigen ligase family protein, partial [Acidobacteria bacterium]|nr:O-antigen ligase family protein [Acidobacteriota bacterium]